MPQTYDVGSLPFEGNLDRFLVGADSYGSSQNEDSTRYFEGRIVSAFEDKVRAGINIPCFPQFRDMNQMFVNLILSGKTVIPEVAAIKNNSKEMYERTGKPVRLKICVTSPYTLASDDKAYKLLLMKLGISGYEYYDKMAEEISKIVEVNVFREKQYNVELITVDDPCLGIFNDPGLDYGSQKREAVIKCLDRILHAAKSKGVKTSIHLHATSNELFFDVNSLDIVESHVDDPTYQSSYMAKRFIKYDKLLKASICITNLDELIKRKMMEATKNFSSPIINEKDSRLGEMVAEEWKLFKKDSKRPFIFLEDVETMRRRLLKILEIYGKHKVPFTGPECGLGGFPSYNVAMEYLRRVAEASNID